MYKFAAQSFWVALAISAVMAWPTLTLLRRIGISSIISPYAPEGHMAKTGTPNMGGVFIIAALVVALALSGVAGICVIIGFAVIGFVDDFVVPRTTSMRGLGWMPKLAMEFGILAVYILMVGGSSSAIWTAFFVVSFANAVNFSDGLDALAGTLMLIALVPFGTYYLMVGNVHNAAMAFAGMGAVIPFLFLNAPPAKVFMGDVGSLALGAMFGLLFSAAPWQSSIWPWAASFVFIIELALVPIQILAVKTIKRRVFPATPIHHGFEKVGWPESRVVWSFALAQVVLSAAALTVIYS
ncbi:MAG: hypothetical protein H0W86_02790 [Armatimonadetes bacterium]|nr:hypothetical protein [Armatimonadota bacterium]